MFAWVLLCGLALSAAAEADSLDRYQWNRRPLLVFAPDASDPRLKTTLARLEGRECELHDRDMVIGIFLEEGESRMDGAVLEPAASRSLRADFGVDEDAFVVILVGKDGGEKLRLAEIPELDEIFGVIDGMPMRRREMLDGPGRCGQ